MAMTMQTHPGERVFELSGMLTFKNLKELQDIQQQMIDSGETTPCVLDLRDVAFIDSSILGLFISLRTQLKDRGITVTLRNPQDKVLKVLYACKYEELFNIEA